MMKTGFIVSAIIALSMTSAACTDDTRGSSVFSLTSSVSVSGKNAAEISLEKEVKSLSQQTKDIIIRNTIDGAVVGAAAGCFMVLLMGGDEKDCAQMAVAGAVVGGAAGNSVGKAAAQKNTELVKKNKILDNLKGINSRLGSIQTKLSTVLASQNSEIVSLKRQLDAKQISSSSYNSRLRSIKENRAVVANSLQAAENDVAKSRVELVGMEKTSGTAYPTLKSAASSTESRLSALRKTINRIPSN